jgi:tripartite-type tricarboxylate transporter receptor subunit TctC
MTIHRRLLVRTLACVAMTLSWSLAPAQAYPAKPITLVVPFAAGSGTDQQARAMAQSITAEYGVPVIVDNKGGASGFLAADYVARAAPDGYTVLITTNTTHAANEHLFKRIPYDPVKDFSPVALVTKGQMLLVVRPDAPFQTVEQLIQAARARPGKLNFGSGSSSSRVASEMLKQLTGIDALNVPYKSNPAGITDLLGGQIDFMFADASTAVPQVKAGKLRALAASGTQRLDSVPDIPTMREAGVKDYDMSFWTAIYLPPKTPDALVKRLHEMVEKVARAPANHAFQVATGATVATAGPEELAQFQASESRKWGRIIRAAGIEPE